MNAVEVRNISKYYALSGSQWTRVRRMFSSSTAGAGRELCALRDVNFSVAPGEALGIVGANGSGKSTLLQIVAGILRPSTGAVTLNGRCSTLLELGSGFAPEFSGRQNVFLNATILGLSQEEIAEKFDAIHRFSGIGDFIDQPIRTYSSGMVLRLAFAVAAHSEPRILIVDEALAVGDVAFRQRCMRRIHELRAAGVTILFVSHDAGDVKALCERCLWLERGTVRGLGEADEVVAKYLATTLNPSAHGAGTATAGTVEAKVDSAAHQPVGALPKAVGALPKGTHRFGDGAAEITAVGFPGTAGSVDFLLRTSLRAKRSLVSPIIGFLVRNKKGETIFGANSAAENHPLPAMLPGEEHAVDFRLTMPRLAAGVYTVSVAIAVGTSIDFRICDYIEDAVGFTVEPEARPVDGYMELRCSAVTVHRH